ncbi:glutamyl aminopeptidase-like [Camponotus floridanus]|uniref:glutamyl aminopeptidase-like n=1 Tax=Camponotus floridanus TaxID=104421 RepID=UPI000DC66566|nr:glutamyl aminopeptidase-like [Camponotus floridanus]
MWRLLLKLLLNSSLIINAIGHLFNSDYKVDMPVGFRLPDYIIPEHYDIQLDLTHFDTEGILFKNISGTCNVNIKITSSTKYISLHAKKPQIEVQNAILTNISSLELYEPTNATYNSETHILVFHFNDQLTIGYYTLKMSFISFADNGESFLKIAYANSYKHKGLFIATPFQAIGARQLFPCWDEPALKATFKISIKHYAKYMILSNMPGETANGNDKNVHLTKFETTPLISTYLVLFVIYDMYPRNPQFHEQYIQETVFADDVTHFITINFLKKWKYSENISDMYNVNLDSHDNIAKKLILYRDATIFYNDELDPDMHKLDVTRTIGYELVHKWFDNLISPSWWSDYWLNEGIAILLGTDVINKGSEDLRMWDLFVVQIQQESLRLDNFTEGVMKPLRSEINKPSEIDSLFSFSFHIKAPVILRMLRHFLTDQVFQNGIEIFLSKHKFSSASIDDFWESMQSAHNATNMEKIIVREIMNAWTKQKHYPILKVAQIYDYTNFHYVRITVENIENHWHIPVTITTQTISNFTIHPWKFFYNWKKSNSTWFMDIATDGHIGDWIIANLQQIGYYRVNYELKNWQNIAKYLNSRNYSKIHVLNRAQIIDDAYYFLSSGKLDMYTFLDLAKYLWQETDFVAWYPMIKALENMSSIFPISDTEDIDLFKEIMKGIFNLVLDRIGYEEYFEENVFTKCLRQEIAKWACVLKDPKCIQMARNKLEQHIMRSDKVSPWWKHWTYNNGILIEKYLNGSCSLILKRVFSFDHKILNFLTSIKEHLNKESLQPDLDHKRHSSQKYIFVNFQDTDSVKKFLSIMKHAKNDKILECILQNLKKIKPREINMVTALIIIINHVYSEAQLQKIIKFVDSLIKQYISNVNNLTNILPSILLDTELDKIHEYMRTIISKQIGFIRRKIGKRLNEIELIQNRARKMLSNLNITFKLIYE